MASILCLMLLWGAAAQAQPVLSAASSTPTQPAASAPRRVEEDVTPFDGGRFVLSRAGNGVCVVALQGTVTRSTGVKFDDVVKIAKSEGCQRPITLLLESPGGLVDVGIDIGRSVRDEGMHTVARYSCASSCANIFLGGAERILWGSRAAVGLHQPVHVVGNQKLEEGYCMTRVSDVPVLAMRRYIRFVIPQTAEEVINVAMTTPCKTITWVKGQRAIELGVATQIKAENEDVFGPASARRAASTPRDAVRAQPVASPASSAPT